MSGGRKTAALIAVLTLLVGVGVIALTERSPAVDGATVTSTQRAPKTVQFSWKRSLPITYGDPSIGTFGGTELRAIVTLGGKLYAANDYWQDSQINNPALPGPQIYRLDDPRRPMAGGVRAPENHFTTMGRSRVSGFFELGKSFLY